MEIPPEESTDLEELEQFAKMFKQKRIKLGKLYRTYQYACLHLFRCADEAFSKYKNDFRIHTRRCRTCNGENVWK